MLHTFFHLLLVTDFTYDFFFHAAYLYCHIVKCINFLRYSEFYVFIKKAFPPGAYTRISHILRSAISMVLFFIFKSLIQVELILILKSKIGTNFTFFWIATR